MYLNIIHNHFTIHNVCHGSIYHYSFDKFFAIDICVFSTDNESETWLRYFKLYYIAFYRGVAPYDIALLKLKTPLTFNKWVSAVKLPEHDEVQVGSAVLSGWGSVSKTWIPRHPNVLQKVTVPLLDSKSCQDEFSKNRRAKQLYDSQICTAAVDEVSACSVNKIYTFYTFSCFCK